MANISNNCKTKCSSCSKTIGKYQKPIQCSTCEKRFHATPACMKSFDTDTNKELIDLCQKCLDDSLPFQSLDHSELTIILNQKNISPSDVDRLNQLKFNPFLPCNDTALCRNSENPDESIYNANKINCNYYLPDEFNQQIIFHCYI